MKDARGILTALPHRYPFLLVDRVLDLTPGQSIHAIKNVTLNEPFFPGHFPGEPVMPGVLIVEALAQAGALLALATTGESHEGKLLLFRGIERARFRRPVVPGDQLHLHVRVSRQRRGFWSFEGEGRVDGEVAAEAELSAAVVANEQARA